MYYTFLHVKHTKESTRSGVSWLKHRWHMVPHIAALALCWGQLQAPEHAKVLDVQ